MANIVNLTGSTVRIMKEGEVLATFEPVLSPACADYRYVLLGTIGRVEVVKLEFGKPRNLPNFSNDELYYIVTPIVAKAAQLIGRPIADLLITVGPLYKDNEVIGWQRFAAPLE